MITQTANRVQTGFRLDPLVLSRVKEAAKQQKLSVNEYVNRTLREATRDIESAEEKEACRKRTNEFLNRFFGAWESSETPEEILQAGKSIKGVREVNAL